MNSRERMLAAIEHRPVDRVPTDIWATPEVMTKLRADFGRQDAWDALHIDGFGWTGPQYIGPPPPPPAADGETTDYWGIRRRKVSYGTGEYDEVSHYPLAAATTIDELEAYNWPRADWFDYSKMAEGTRAGHDRRLVSCGYIAPFYFHNLLRGQELSLMDPLVEPEFTHHLLGKIMDFFLDQHRRMFQAAGGLIDVTQVTDDLGTQNAPMISLDTYRRFYRPHMERACALAHEFGIKVLHHDDGAIRPFIPDLIAVGVDILNPIQWRCPGMALEGLKKDFGRQLCFHGGIDNQQTLPFGSTDDVRAEVRTCIDTLAADGTGYILAPCHALQAVTPVENIVAMFDEAQKYGKRW